MQNVNLLIVKNSDNEVVNYIRNSGVESKTYSELVTREYTKISEAEAKEKLKQTTHIFTFDESIEFYITSGHTVVAVPLWYKKEGSVLKNILVSISNSGNKYFYYVTKNSHSFDYTFYANYPSEY